ncbi:unnamed protein product [Albugo candida]|uniref:histone acetyltransferase n=1 Tax=Albugo candida TaxID=65357 RepID=A0A024GMF7_9STRA|nr:unnamed protein product [Albugo candida]|eukprot:CCI47893.1 unnamed protein product [Albugo candida]
MVELNEVAKNSASEPQAIERQWEELSTDVFETNPENNIITPKTVNAATNPEALTEASITTESVGSKRKLNDEFVPTQIDCGATEINTDLAAPVVMKDISSSISASREELARKEEENGLIKFEVIKNDGEAEHMIQLTTLKNIFARQLPKMPREYIVRLVFDRNHRSLLLLKDGTRVIGGISYRPFVEQHFAEIAFCAINAADQVRGYGTRLMNHLKEHVKTIGINYFLTYADNYAIGYFKKQGFSKIVSQPKSKWFGYIKDYDGGTLMECLIYPNFNYLRTASLVHKQRMKIYQKLQKRSRAHLVYPGLTKFAESRLIDIHTIPGIREAGWSQAMVRNNKLGSRDHGSLKTRLTQLWKAISSHRSAWPFHEPVDTKVVIDYLDHIKVPIDLSEIAKRIDRGAYLSKAAFKADLELMCKNCTTYNTPDTTYYKAAVDLQEFIDRRIQIRGSDVQEA